MNLATEQLSNKRIRNNFPIPRWSHVKIITVCHRSNYYKHIPRIKREGSFYRVNPASAARSNVDNGVAFQFMTGQITRDYRHEHTCMHEEPFRFSDRCIISSIRARSLTQRRVHFSPEFFFSSSSSSSSVWRSFRAIGLLISARVAGLFSKQPRTNFVSDILYTYNRSCRETVPI